MVYRHSSYCSTKRDFGCKIFNILLIFRKDIETGEMTGLTRCLTTRGAIFQRISWSDCNPILADSVHSNLSVDWINRIWYETVAKNVPIFGKSQIFGQKLEFGAKSGISKAFIW